MFAIILFPTISEYIGGQKRIKSLLFLFGFVWWVLTALSRLTMGAHYLTDVAFGGLITLTAYIIVLIAKNIYIKQKNKKGK